MLFHTYGVQLGHDHTSRSVCSPAFHAPHKTSHPLGLGILEKNMDVLVFLANISPPQGYRKALAGTTHKGFLIIFLYLNNNIIQ
jgi:hypothetical protein